ncbi:hypothetical protein SBA4_3730013 [Candidatus Sulfopaludibacter sp. SbA4]|nr:hypothetical protein SBA4_3730013 [Candidatus Sulfopaludibacter sp. SbA4]
MGNTHTGSDRQELHALVDHVRESDIASAQEYLRTLIDPFELALLMAEPDDEPLTDHEREALAEAERRRQRGERPLTHEEVLRELGFTESDLR